MLRQSWKVMLVWAALVGGAGCGGDGNPAAPEGPIDPADLEFAPALGVDLAQMTKTSTGLYLQDLVVGTGPEAQVGKEVTVHYTAWLHDGTKADSSYDYGQPFTFVLDETQVIQGWVEGLQGVKVGGMRKLVVPSDLAYGKKGSGGIVPPYATLVFDVQLLDVTDP